MTEAIKLLWCALAHHMYIMQQQEIKQPKSKKDQTTKKQI